MTRQETTQLAQQEFNKFKKQLQRFGVEIEVFEQEHSLPDSICTDWFMTVRNEIFPKGVLILGAMKTEQRRKERSQQIIDVLSNYYNDVIDLSHFESENLALELQGSIVPDWKNAKIYCSFSHRSDKVVFEYLIGRLNEISQAYTGKLITGITFTSHDMEDKQIYHTDVMLSILDKHIILCAELIRDEDMRDSVIAELTDPDLNDEHRELILISEQE